MLEKISGWLSAAGAVVVAVLGGLFMLERSKRKDAEAENLTNELKAEDEKLEAKSDALDEKIKAGKEALKEAPPQTKDKTPEEIEKYWNKK